MIKSMFGALALFIFLLAVPVSGQIIIDTDGVTSANALEAESDWLSAQRLVEYLVQTQGDDQCTATHIGENTYGAVAYLCVFQDPLEDRVILYGAVDGGLDNARIFVLRDAHLIAVGHRESGFEDLFMILHDLDHGTYEVLFTSGADDRKSFWFLIEASEEG